MSALAETLPAAEPSPSGPEVDTGVRRKKERGPGRVLPHRFGRYTLVDHVGRGGMADIYLASEETGFGGRRRVIIKEVLRDLADDARYADLLVAEAKLAARLGHANVVKVEDLGRTADEGALYIAMEYVEGFDLRELLRACARRKVSLPIDFSVLVVTEALRGLDYAHRAGVVHRDVSPSNVLLSFEGEVKLCDFGIARAAEVAAAPNPALDEAIQGKAGYMSPEQAWGEPVDGRSDVFAAGVILWELLAGRRLYRAREGEALLDVARRAEIPALPLRDLPDERRLHGVVHKALSREASDRYASAAAMRRDLEAWAVAARMGASSLKLGEWLVEHFGADVLGARRLRERAAQALALGPAMTLTVTTPAPPAAEPVETTAPTPLVRPRRAAKAKKKAPASKPRRRVATQLAALDAGALPVVAPRRGSSLPWVAFVLASATILLALAATRG